jgi:H+/Cl- antiporter ClcA
MSRKIELVFAAFFAWFVYGWLTFDIPEAFGLDYNMTAWYAREIDPIFRDPPSWLKIFGWYAVAYGPFYAATAYGFLRRRPWLPYVLLPLTGMMVVSVGTYFVEELTGDVQPLNWTMFYVLNSAHLVVPVLAALWIIARMRKTATVSASRPAVPSAVPSAAP